jgi:hypothetical protein
MVAGVNEGQDMDVPMISAVGAPAGGQAPLSGTETAIPESIASVPMLPGLPSSPALARAAARLTLAAPTLEESLSSRKDHHP